MELAVRNISLDLEQTNAFTQRLNSSGRILGSFDHLTGFLDFFYKKEWPAKFASYAEINEFIRTHFEGATNDHDRAVRLLECTAFVHEGRHFHDCFFTPVGVSLLEQSLMVSQMMQTGVAQAIREAKAGSIPLRLPLRRWALEHGSPELRRFVAHLNGHISELSMTLGPGPLAYVQGHDFDHDIYMVTLHANDGENNPVPCTIKNMLLDGSPFRSIWPLGFTVFAECLALIEQELYTNDVSPRAQRLIRNHLGRDDDPYLVLIALFVRLFKRHKIKARVPDSLIYECAWRSLFAPTVITNYSARVDYDAIGREFMRIITEYLHVTGSEVDWKPPTLDRTLRPRPAIPEHLPMNILRHVNEKYFRQAMTIEMKDVPYPTEAGYTYIAGRLPPPPAMFTLAGEININDVEFFRGAQQVMLYRHIVFDAWLGTIIECPVRGDRARSIRLPEPVLPSQATCKKALEAFSCGLWAPGAMYSGPKCLWSHLLSEVEAPSGEPGDSLSFRMFSSWGNA